VLDSSASIGSHAGGRSSSRQVDALLKKRVPHVGPTDIHGGFGWAPSEENPGDDPTRKKKIRDPIPVGNDVAVLVAREAARWPRLKKAYRERNAGL